MRKRGKKVKQVIFKNNVNVPIEPLFLFGNCIATHEQYRKKTLSFAEVVEGEVWQNGEMIANAEQWCTQVRIRTLDNSKENQVDLF